MHVQEQCLWSQVHHHRTRVDEGVQTKPFFSLRPFDHPSPTNAYSTTRWPVGASAASIAVIPPPVRACLSAASRGAGVC